MSVSLFCVKCMYVCLCVCTHPTTTHPAPWLLSSLRWGGTLVCFTGTVGLWLEALILWLDAYSFNSPLLSLYVSHSFTYMFYLIFKDHFPFSVLFSVKRNRLTDSLSFSFSLSLSLLRARLSSPDSSLSLLLCVCACAWKREKAMRIRERDRAHGSFRLSRTTHLHASLSCLSPLLLLPFISPDFEQREQPLPRGVSETGVVLACCKFENLSFPFLSLSPFSSPFRAGNKLRRTASEEASWIQKGGWTGTNKYSPLPSQLTVWFLSFKVVQKELWSFVTSLSGGSRECVLLMLKHSLKGFINSARCDSQTGMQVIMCDGLLDAVQS